MSRLPTCRTCLWPNVRKPSCRGPARPFLKALPFAAVQTKHIACSGSPMAQTRKLRASAPSLRNASAPSAKAHGLCGLHGRVGVMRLELKSKRLWRPWRFLRLLTAHLQENMPILATYHGSRQGVCCKATLLQTLVGMLELLCEHTFYIQKHKVKAGFQAACLAPLSEANVSAVSIPKACHGPAMKQSLCRNPSSNRNAKATNWCLHESSTRPLPPLPPLPQPRLDSHHPWHRFWPGDGPFRQLRHGPSRSPVCHVDIRQCGTVVI